MYPYAHIPLTLYQILVGRHLVLGHVAGLRGLTMGEEEADGENERKLLVPTFSTCPCTAGGQPPHLETGADSTCH